MNAYFKIFASSEQVDFIHPISIDLEDIEATMYYAARDAYDEYGNGTFVVAFDAETHAPVCTYVFSIENCLIELARRLRRVQNTTANPFDSDYDGAEWEDAIDSYGAALFDTAERFSLNIHEVERRVKQYV